MDNRWSHNVLRYQWLMPMSCYFRNCKVLLVMSMTYVSGAITSIPCILYYLAVAQHRSTYVPGVAEAAGEVYSVLAPGHNVTGPTWTAAAQTAPNQLTYVTHICQHSATHLDKQSLHPLLPQVYQSTCCRVAPLFICWKKTCNFDISMMLKCTVMKFSHLTWEDIGYIVSISVSLHKNYSSLNSKVKFCKQTCTATHTHYIYKKPHALYIMGWNY